MKNLIRVSLFFFCTGLWTWPLQAQLRFVPWSQSYVPVTSYLGKEMQERFNSFKFELNGLHIDKKNWSLSARLVSPISIARGGPNRSGKTFPADKISLRWTVDSNDPRTNLNTIGVNRNPIPLQPGNEVLLIDRSKTPLSSYGGYYSEITLFSSLKLDGGKYLEDFQSGIDQYTHIHYNVPVMFTLYDEQGIVMGSQQINYELHIHPVLTDEGAVDIEPDYGLEIVGEAADATLSFYTNKDYSEGVSLTLDNAVKVNARTDFEVRVKSLDPTFMHSGGDTLPLSIFSLQLDRGQGSANVIANPTLVLSDVEQRVLSGTSTDKKAAQFFHLNYKAKLTPAQALSSKPGTYTVSLLYLLMPR